MSIVFNGFEMAGTTADRPDNIEPGQPFFNTSLAQQQVWDGSDWLSLVTQTSTGFAPAVKYADGVVITLGTDLDFTLGVVDAGTAFLQILPKTDDAGAVHIGNGTLDCDFKVFMGAVGDYVEFDADQSQVNFVDVDIQLDDDAVLIVGIGADLVLSTNGTDGSVDNADGGSVLVGAVDAAAVRLGKAAGGTFVKSRLVSFQPAPETAINTANLTDPQIIGGILLGTPTAAASYTLRTGTQIEDALEAIVGDLAVNDSFELVIVNLAGTTTWDITLIDAAVAGVTIIGNPVIGALADVATEQESQGTFRFRRTAANTFDVIRIG